MKCENCGKENSVTSRFCVSCGKRLVDIEERQNNENCTIESLLKRVDLFLEDGRWNNAIAYCEKLLDSDPENSNVYIRMLMAEFHIKKMEELEFSQVPLEKSCYYQKMIRFADEEQKTYLESINQKILSENEEKRCRAVYEKVVAQLSIATKPDEYEQIIELLKSIEGYRDTDTLLETCKEQFAKLEMKRERIMKTVSLIGLVFVIVVVIISKIIVPNVRYHQAKKMMESGDYVQSYLLFGELGEYKDSRSLRKELENRDSMLHIKVAEVGDTIKFGCFEQDNNSENGKESIEWIVLDKKDNKVLLLSKMCLENMSYGSTKKAAWDTSQLRRWLNSFAYKAFSTEERNFIVDTSMETQVDYFDSDNVVSTKDKVFVLSEKEVKKYMPTKEERITYSTAYAEERENGRLLGWWLRDTGEQQMRANVVDKEGRLSVEWVDPSSWDCRGVRPAIWLSVE